LPKRQKFSIHAPRDEIIMYDPQLEFGPPFTIHGALCPHK